MQNQTTIEQQTFIQSLKTQQDAFLVDSGLSETLHTFMNPIQLHSATHLFQENFLTNHLPNDTSPHLPANLAVRVQVLEVHVAQIDAQINHLTEQFSQTKQEIMTAMQEQCLKQVLAEQQTQEATSDRNAFKANMQALKISLQTRISDFSCSCCRW